MNLAAARKRYAPPPPPPRVTGGELFKALKASSLTLTMGEFDAAFAEINRGDETPEAFVARLISSGYTGSARSPIRRFLRK